MKVEMNLNGRPDCLTEGRVALESDLMAPPE